MIPNQYVIGFSVPAAGDLSYFQSNKIMCVLHKETPPCTDCACTQFPLLRQFRRMDSFCLHDHTYKANGILEQVKYPKLPLICGIAVSWYTNHNCTGKYLTSVYFPVIHWQISKCCNWYRDFAWIPWAVIFLRCCVHCILFSWVCRQDLFLTNNQPSIYLLLHWFNYVPFLIGRAEVSSKYIVTCTYAQNRHKLALV